MSDWQVEAEVRDKFGKNATRRLRTEGKIPAVVYGSDLDNMSLSVDPKQLIQILRSESGHNTIFTLRVEKQAADVLIQDYQLDPIKGNLIHVDFQTIKMDELHDFEVPVQVEGVPSGVKNQGGVLDLVLREIDVQCLPADLPDNIHVDVSDLEIGDAIRVEDLALDTAKIKILSEPDRVVVTVVPPDIEEEPEEEEEELELAEPEVIQKGKPEEEEEEAAAREEEEKG